MDYIGPMFVRLEGQKTKVWILIITCMWSRAINLLLCRTASTEHFIRAIQMHINMYGIFSNAISDLGSNIQAGSNIISTFLNNPDTSKFLQYHNVKHVKFDAYPKGNSSLGSLVEICVKQVKLLINKSIRKLVLDYFEFELLLSSAVNLINKRPISFQQNLNSLATDELPLAISPEMVIKGYETCSLNVIPQLQRVDDDDDSDSYVVDAELVRKNYSSLCKARNRMTDIYHSEFLGNLIQQAVDKNDRFKPVPHTKLAVGNLVLLIEKNSKRNVYPMGRVVSVESNDLGEVTAARVLKGDSREVVYRHATSLILLLACGEGGDSKIDNSRKTRKFLLLACKTTWLSMTRPQSALGELQQISV